MLASLASKFNAESNFILVFWPNLYLEHKVIFKKCLIEQRFGNFFIYLPVNKLSSNAFRSLKTKSISQWLRLRLSFCLSADDLSTLNLRRSCEEECDRNKTSVIAKENTFTYNEFFFRYGSTLELFCIAFCQYFHGDEMSTEAVKKRIYEAKVKTYFVLQPRIEIKN